MLQVSTVATKVTQMMPIILTSYLTKVVNIATMIGCLLNKEKRLSYGNNNISELQIKVWYAQDSSSKGSKSFVRC